MGGNYRFISSVQKQNILLLARDHRPLQIAKLLRISHQTVYSVLNHVQQHGDVPRTPKRSGRPCILDGLDTMFLESLVERTPDITLYELQEELDLRRDIWVGVDIISRTLKTRGWTRKRINYLAYERDDQRRAIYQMYMGATYHRWQLVFVDEAGCNRYTQKRMYGWALCGERARRSDFFVRKKKYSILPAISLSGVLYLDVYDHSVTGHDFNTFIEALLDKMNPFPGPNSVIVMDNASIHKSPELRPLIEERGMKLEYLPPYSPDYDPIEEGFSAMKAWMRANRDYVQGELSGEPTADPYAMIWMAVHESMPPENIAGWYDHAGYWT